MFCQLFSLQNKSFLCLQHVENKGFQTVIKHRLKAIQKPIKNELGNREKKYRKCTFRFEKMHISFSRLYSHQKKQILWTIFSLTFTQYSHGFMAILGQATFMILMAIMYWG